MGSISRRPAARLIIACAALWVWNALAAVEAPREYEVKAAFLLNFTKFIDWPATASGGADTPFSICILGDDPFGAALDRMVEGESVNGRKLVIERSGSPPPESCQVLFASGSEKDFSKVLAGLGPGVLTVGEGDRFLRDGGMIAFVVEHRRVRFDINQAAASKAELKISSKLLSVARTVEK
jgi:hypothetical protein